MPALIALLLWAASAAAQTPAPAPQQQPERGRQQYLTACAHCHSSDLLGDPRQEIPSLAGDDFFVRWGNRNARELYDVISIDMPADRPGGLTRQAYADIVAYILQVNELSAGEAALRGDAGALEQIVLQPAAPEVPNLTLIQAVGCLVEADPGRWTLARAGAVVPTEDVPPSDGELREAAAAPAGRLTFQLVSVRPFGPEAHRGQRVLLKGIINRYPGEDPLLNVTALAPVAPGC